MITPSDLRFSAELRLPSRIADITVDLPLQNVERHHAGPQHHIVKFAQGESVSQRLLRLFAKLHDLQFTDHVGTGLSWKYRVPLHLTGLDTIIDALLPRPLHRVNAGVDHQPPRAKKFVVQLAEQSLKV